MPRQEIEEYAEKAVAYIVTMFFNSKTDYNSERF